MNGIRIKTMLTTTLVLCMALMACSANTDKAGQSSLSEMAEAEEISQDVRLGAEDVQQVIDPNTENTLKIYTADVTIGGEVWSRQHIRIEESVLMKMDDKGPFQLVVSLKGPPIVGKEEAYLRFLFAIPADYDGSPIRHNLDEAKDDNYVISFSEDNEAFTTWLAPFIETWDDVNKKAINNPRTSGTVTLESFNQSTKRLRISFDALLFGASSDTTTHTNTAKGIVELDFSVYDLLEEAEKMKKEYGC